MRGTLPRHTPRIALVVAAGLVLAACATDEPEAADVEDAEVTESADATADTEDEEADAPGQPTVQVAGTDLGEVLVDAGGHTLYLFDPDEQGASTCYDDCAASWPPLLESDPVAGDGLEEALLGTTEREDGSTQVTYDGWPLYHWAGDAQPGDTEGQGVQEVWWVLGADGQPLRDAADAGQDEDDARSGY
jgi:predicted lipoprotein with Yx(FWY)xxD motif